MLFSSSPCPFAFGLVTRPARPQISIESKVQFKSGHSADAFGKPRRLDHQGWRNPKPNSRQVLEPPIYFRVLPRTHFARPHAFFLLRVMTTVLPTQEKTLRVTVVGVDGEQWTDSSKKQRPDGQIYQHPDPAL